MEQVSLAGGPSLRQVVMEKQTPPENGTRTVWTHRSQRPRRSSHQQRHVRQSTNRGTAPERADNVTWNWWGCRCG
ncbi:hypothetical protein P4534_03525 [Peribacillus butanolivorans]|uniref:hypothetical protein n=1 Tax=Peribacillus butanolivorans TaxID=421767 RepID=UPI002E251936|nr:hypothetical protein [Peribacillus butanolivorans]